MKIVLENIGSISKASIEISNLTVISGENDSGKTTISKVAYALGQATSSFKNDFRQYQEYEINRAYSQLYMYLTRYLDREAFINQDAILFDEHSHSIDIKEENLNLQLIELVNNLRRWGGASPVALHELEVVENLLYRLFNSNIFPEELIDRLKRLLIDIKQKIEDFIEKPPTSKFIHRALKSEFSDEIVKLCNNDISKAKLELYDGEHKVFEITFDNKDVLSFEGDSFLRIADSTLIEGPAIFQISALLGRSSFDRSNRDRKTRLAVPYHVTDLCAKLNGTRDALTNMLEDSICDESTWNLTEFYEGSINYEDATELFKLSKQGHKYHGNNTSSGIKALAILDLLIKGNYITKNTILILDEPETNLHPTWQKKYARAIVNLAANGAKVLVNTHSPYMLEALNIYSAQEKSRLFRSRFYYAYRDQQGTSYFQDTNGNISAIIDALSAPLYDLISEYQENVDDF